MPLGPVKRELCLAKHNTSKKPKTSSQSKYGRTAPVKPAKKSGY